MNTAKKYIWKVPLFCVVSGIAMFRVAVFLLSRFAIVTLADGTITSDNTRALIVYGVIFLTTLLIGGLFIFRNMTKKEIFLSASILVVFTLTMVLIQWAFNLTTGPSAIFFVYVSQIYEWSTIVPQLLYKLNDNIWLGGVINSFTPYLFILFGRKSA